jgi:hypothetical protein
MAGMKPALASLVVGLLGGSCVNPNTANPYSDRALQVGPPPPAPSADQKPAWKQWQPLFQGFLGATFYDTVFRTGGNPFDVNGESGGVNQMLMLGGGAQWKVGGESVDYGMEGLLSFEGRKDGAAIASAGTVTVPIEVDLYVIDLYGGPFASTFLSDKLRVYGGAGPMLRYADYEQHRSATGDHGSGLGLGGYVRGGLEWVFPSHTMIGLGARWSDSHIGLSGDLGELHLQGYQVYLTLSRGI